MDLDKYMKSLPAELLDRFNYQANQEVFNRFSIVAAKKRMAPEWRAPDDNHVMTLEELLACEDEKVTWLVEGMIAESFNHVLTAQYKTGKSTLVMNLARNLADGTDFLRHFSVHVPEGNIGFWNAEMTKASFTSYIRGMDVQNAGRVHTVHLRGKSMDILNDTRAREWTEKWLRDNQIKVWIIDTWGRLCAWCGVSENKNDEVGLLLAKIDEIKRTVDDSIATVITAHTGRTQHEIGLERVRGATVLDDWADVRLLYVKDAGKEGEPRFMHGEGRNVYLREFQVSHDGETGELCINYEGGSRASVNMNELVEQIALLVAQNPSGITNSELHAAFINTDLIDKSRAIKLAVERGMIIKHETETGAFFTAPADSQMPHYMVPIENRGE
jgi:hypothetical protein